jgi:UrcA family protein
MKRLNIFVATAIVAACSFSIAHADSNIEQRYVRVRFADIDTSDRHGAQVLYRRIRNAAKSVCQDLEPDHELSAMPLYADCVRNAIGDAIVKIDRPTVTAYAAAQGVFEGDTRDKFAVD